LRQVVEIMRGLRTYKTTQPEYNMSTTWVQPEYNLRALNLCAQPDFMDF